jgi:23S rRNA maturation mini-RNase III
MVNFEVEASITNKIREFAYVQEEHSGGLFFLQRGTNSKENANKKNQKIMNMKIATNFKTITKPLTAHLHSNAWLRQLSKPS